MLVRLRFRFNARVERCDQWVEQHEVDWRVFTALFLALAIPMMSFLLAVAIASSLLATIVAGAPFRPEILDAANAGISTAACIAGTATLLARFHARRV